MDSETTYIVLGASSGIFSKIVKNFSKKSDIYLIYNNNYPIRIKNSKKIRINFNNLNELKKKLNKIKIQRKKIVLLNFASIKLDKLSFNVNNKNLKETFNINTFAFLHIVQSILPFMMKNKWGRIINFSSTGGSKGEKGTLLYTSSKNATDSMVKVMSKEYAKFNITFNTINLGNFNTGLFKKLSFEMRNKIKQNIPSKKTGDFKNIYSAIKFIIISEYVNGSTITIDGGYNI